MMARDREDNAHCGHKARSKAKMRRFLGVHSLLACAAVVGCEPDAFLGNHILAPGTNPSVGFGGARPDTAGSPSLDDPGLISEGGRGGAAGSGNDDGLLQDHQCSVTYPGEDHDEPIAVCCEMNPIEDAWRDEVFLHINAARLDAGRPAFERDPALDQAAMGYALHWWLHWSPEEKFGYPGRNYGPTVLSEACGSAATLLFRSDAQDEPRLANGMIDPAFPADYWKTDDNISVRFFDAGYERMGFAFYDGLLVAFLGRPPEDSPP